MNADVKSCSRCGKGHDAMPFIRLVPPVGEWTHVGTCPETGMAVFLRIATTDSLHVNFTQPESAWQDRPSPPPDGRSPFVRLDGE